MNLKNTVLSLLLLSAVCVPAQANYFSNPRLGVNLNVGSAPSPTPEQLRAIGDSFAAPDRPYYRERNVPPPRARYSYLYDNDVVADPALTAMEGRTVFGTRGVRLGYVLAVDSTTNEVELQTRGGIAIAMPANLISNRDGRLIAPTTSLADVRDMARSQTGRTVAANVTWRARGG